MVVKRSRLVRTTGAKGHLPAPSATVGRAGHDEPWTTLSVIATTAGLRDLTGDTIDVPRTSVRFDPLSP